MSLGASTPSQIHPWTAGPRQNNQTGTKQPDRDETTGQGQNNWKGTKQQNRKISIILKTGVGRRLVRSNE